MMLQYVRGSRSRYEGAMDKKKMLEDSSAAKAVGARKRIADDIKLQRRKKPKLFKDMNAEKEMIDHETSKLRKNDC